MVIICMVIFFIPSVHICLRINLLLAHGVVVRTLLGVMTNGSLFRWDGPDLYDGSDGDYPEIFDYDILYQSVQRSQSHDCWITKSGIATCPQLGRNIEVLRTGDWNITFTGNESFGAAYQTAVCAVVDGEAICTGMSDGCDCAPLHSLSRLIDRF
jgi:hypothetical protein